MVRLKASGIDEDGLECLDASPSYVSSGRFRLPLLKR